MVTTDHLGPSLGFSGKNDVIIGNSDNIHGAKQFGATIPSLKSYFQQKVFLVITASFVFAYGKLLVSMSALLGKIF